MNKRIAIFGGGTISHLRNHLALCAPAFGSTAEKIQELCREIMPNMRDHLFLTQMACAYGDMVTNADVEAKSRKVIADLDYKIVFFSCAMCDFDGRIGTTPSGKYATRLKTADLSISFAQATAVFSANPRINLVPAPKVINLFRQGPESRKDIFLVGFKTTCGATEEEQYIEGLGLVKKASCNLVLANDTQTRLNMVITPEEAKYHVTTDRDEALRGLVEMAYLRSQLTFTRSTVVAGERVPWNSPEVPEALRAVVNHCVARGAYKPFNGATVGHFAAKLDETTFLTSIRKSNFNDIEKNGLVRIKTDGPDTVLAYGAKPSVGGQSQRIVFENHPDCDCIAHFHCPIRAGSQVPTISQREYECGSHECGARTSAHLKQFGNLKSVYLDQHGPNIVFNRNIDPQEVIDFIEANFDLEDKTGGPVQIKLSPEKIRSSLLSIERSHEEEEVRLWTRNDEIWLSIGDWVDDDAREKIVAEIEQITPAKITVEYESDPGENDEGWTEVWSEE